MRKYPRHLPKDAIVVLCAPHVKLTLMGDETGKTELPRTSGFRSAWLRILSFVFCNSMVFRGMPGIRLSWEDIGGRGVVSSEPDPLLFFYVLHKLEEEWVRDAEPLPKGVGSL